MAVDLRVTLDEDEVLSEIKDSIGVSRILEILDLDADAILDEIYFSNFLDSAISRDQEEVESDIANSNLDLIPAEKVYDPDILHSIKSFFKTSLEVCRTPETVLLALKNEAALFGWELTFTKTL